MFFVEIEVYEEEYIQTLLVVVAFTLAANTTFPKLPDLYFLMRRVVRPLGSTQTARTFITIILFQF